MRLNLILGSMFAMCLFSLNTIAGNVGGVEVDSNGNAIVRTQAQATQYCKSKSLRLPTARELAELAVSMGAQPIRETAYKNLATNTQAVQGEMDQNFKDGYYAFLQSGGAAKLVVDFYYSPSGYPQPVGDAEASFWSSTPGISSRTGSLFFGKWGVLGEAADLNWTAAVRCSH